MTKPISRSELGRLGKRGSYRLGTLAPQGVGRPLPPRPFRPSFSRTRHAGPTWAWIAAGMAGAGLIGLAALAGLWFVPLVIGVIGGIAGRGGQGRLRGVVPAAVVISAAGGGAALGDPAAAALAPLAAPRGFAA